MNLYKRQLLSIVKVEKIDNIISPDEVQAHLCNPSVLMAEHFNLEMKWSLMHQILTIIRTTYEFCLKGVVPDGMFENKLKTLWEDRMEKILQDTSELWDKYYRPCLSCLYSDDEIFSPIPCEQPQAHCNHGGGHMSESRLKVSFNADNVYRKHLRSFRRRCSVDTPDCIEDACWASGEPGETKLLMDTKICMDELRHFYDKVVTDIATHHEHAESIISIYQSVLVAEAYHSFNGSDGKNKLFECENKDICLVCGGKYDPSTNPCVSLSVCRHSLCKRCCDFVEQPLEMYTHNQCQQSILDINIGEFKFGQLVGNCPFCCELMTDMMSAKQFRSSKA